METADSESKRQRRKRRTREDVAERIRDAARKLFTERGFAATTTKEIARIADVSETLLFRYHGGKAALFDEVVSAPFNLLVEEFVAIHSDRANDATRKIDARRFVGQVFGLLEDNREMFYALLAARHGEGGGQLTAPLHGLDRFFNSSVVLTMEEHDLLGQAPGCDLDIAVRLGFGMVASSVLLTDWLFPTHAPSRAAIIRVLEYMVQRTIDPALLD